MSNQCSFITVNMHETHLAEFEELSALLQMIELTALLVDVNAVYEKQKENKPENILTFFFL